MPDLTRNDTPGRNKKRKADSPVRVPGAQRAGITELVDSMLQEVAYLKKATGDASNTKREIKDS